MFSRLLLNLQQDEASPISPLVFKKEIAMKRALTVSKVPTADDMTSLTALELNNLSIQEREAVYDDLHAVRSTQDPPLEEMNQKIQELRREVQNSRLAQVYNKAKFLNPAYVDGRKFLLLFLRTTDYIVKEAAQLLANHFIQKLEIFGPNCIGRRITYSDLNDETRRILSSGLYSIFPRKDLAGRSVLLINRKFQDSKSSLDAVSNALYTNVYT